MKKMLLFFSLFTVLAAATCKKEDAEENIPPGSAKLRIENGTPFTIDSCYISPGTWNGHDYGLINVNSLTDYFGFDSVYHYGYIRVKMNNKIYPLVPFDYVGETPYRKGNFTYKITYSNTLDQINLTFRQE